MAERGKGFPRLSLGSAVKIIETASKFGKTWPKEQFAGFGSQSGAGSAKSGAFANRVAALKDYGLIATSKDSVTLTDLSIQIAKPVTKEERTKAIYQAFMNAEIFKKLFDGLDPGEELPLDQVAQYAVFTLGVSRESKDKFLSVFIDSGRFVNLVKHNKEKSTITLAQVTPNKEQPQPDTNEPAEDQKKDGTLTPAMPIVQSIGSDSEPVTQTGFSSRPTTEQGVNYSGDGWILTVLLKTSMRLDANTRKKVRDIIEAADILSDELHGLERGGK